MALSRPLASALVVASLAAGALGAQSRFTVTPLFGRGTTSPLVDHVVSERVALPTPEGGTVDGTHTRRRHFEVYPAPMVGARVETPVGRWSGSLTATYSRTESQYVEDVNDWDPRDQRPRALILYGPDLAVRQTADVITLGLGAGRRVPLVWRFALDASAGAGARWISRGRNLNYSCGSEARMEWCHVPFRRHNIMPEANASLALRTRLTDGVSLEVRGTGMSGFSLTRSFIYRGGVPRSESASWAPDTRGTRPNAEHVYSSMLSVGLSFRQ